MLIGTGVGIVAGVIVVSALTERKQIVIKADTKNKEQSVATVALREVAYSTTNKNNVKEWDLQARSAQYFQNEKKVILEGVVVNLYRPDGSVYHIQGDRGEYNTETKDIAMNGSVHGTMADNTTIYTDSFYYDHARKIIKTDAPIVIQRGGLRLEGVGMIVELEKEKLTLLGKVKATGSK